MKQPSYEKRSPQFAFKLNDCSMQQSESEEEINNNDMITQMLLLNNNLTEQQILAFIKNQENEQVNSIKKSHFSINKDQQEKITQFFQKYEPIYFNHALIREMSSKFNKGVYIIKYKEGFYFGEVVESLDQQNVSKKIKQGKGIFVYILLEKSNQQNKRIYEGQWLNDQRNGLGFQKFADGSVYHGNYYDNKPGGRGKLTNSLGQIYEGQWKDGIKQGKGFWQGVHGQTFMGEWFNGKPHGYGVFVNHLGDRYEGELRNRLKHGQGIQRFINGDIYKGLFQNNQPHGYGQYFWKNKSYFKGNFSNGLRSGHGMWKKGAGNQDKYEGQYQNDKKWGYGVFTWANGNVFKGSYEADLRNGYGEMFWTDGSYYKGNWKNGIQHGKGELFVMKQGLRVGQFQNNQIVSIQYEQPWEEQLKEEINQPVAQRKQDKKLLRNHSKTSNNSLKSKNSMISAFKKHRAAFNLRNSLQPIKTKQSDLSFTHLSKNERNKIHSQTSSGMLSVPLKNLIKDNQRLRYFSKATFFKPQSGFRMTEKSINIQKTNQTLDESRVSNNPIPQQRKNRILHSSFYLRKFKKVKSSDKQQLISWK